jgi:hypothetical protein
MGQQPMAQCVAVTSHHYYLNQLTQKTINQGGKMNNLIHKKLGLALISGCLMMWVGIAQAAPLVVFSNGGVADADDVNANFNELGARIETISLTPGADGANGTNGAAGNDGAAGADSTVAGPKGDTGADSTVAGPKGDPGTAGAIGGIGDTGAKGDTGAAGADSTVAGPTGPAGLGAVVFSTAPTVNDDMNSPYSVGTVWINTSAATAYILVDNSANAAVWTALGGSAIGSLYAIGDGSRYAIGDAGPAGGIVFHVTDGGLHGLEVATVDQVSTQWGCNGTLISGANGTVVGTGEQNTADIIAGCNETTAASVAAAYGPGWYLPSKDELNMLYAQKAAGVVGGFDNFFYWSSSQINSGNAWNQDFFNGDQIENFVKSNSLRVRAVRAF